MKVLFSSTSSFVSGNIALLKHAIKGNYAVSWAYISSFCEVSSNFNFPSMQHAWNLEEIKKGCKCFFFFFFFSVTIIKITGCNRPEREKQ
jgi:hypothetical protein